MRLLVDTNVFLDLFYNRGELAEISSKFLNSTGDHKDVIYVAATSIKDMAYFIKKAYHDDKKTNEYLITIYGKICKIVSITDDDAISALYEDGDYEDNLLVLTAETNMCDAIISNNKRHFVGKGICTLTPKEYLEIR